MKNKVIRLTESKLHKIITESIIKILNEEVKFNHYTDSYQEYTALLNDFIRLNGSIQKLLITKQFKPLLNRFYQRFSLDPNNLECDYNALYQYLSKTLYHEYMGEYA